PLQVANHRGGPPDEHPGVPEVMRRSDVPRRSLLGRLLGELRHLEDWRALSLRDRAYAHVAVPGLRTRGFQAHDDGAALYGGEPAADLENLPERAGLPDHVVRRQDHHHSVAVPPQDLVRREADRGRGIARGGLRHDLSPGDFGQAATNRVTRELTREDIGPLGRDDVFNTRHSLFEQRAASIQLEQLLGALAPA